MLTYNSLENIKWTILKQQLYHKNYIKNSTREGQVSLVSTDDVTNPPVHYCNWSLVYFRFQKVENVQKQIMKSKTK